MAQPTPSLRIGHAERDQTMALLQEHTTAGRLDLDEFEERVEQVTRARTRADLDAVLIDLPKATQEPYTAAVSASGMGRPPVPLRQTVRRFRGPVPGWISLSLLMVAIWAMAGFGYFWPIWVIVPTAFGAFGSWGHGNWDHGRPRHGHHPHHGDGSFYA